jgi:putative transposase
LTLIYYDQCGFSASLPITSTWTLPKSRVEIPFANRHRQRQNVTAAFIPDGLQAGLYWRTIPGPIRTHHVLVTLEELRERLAGELVVVMDNASMHTSKEMKAALPALAEQGLHVYYLPAYTPELNAIERVFGDLKAHRFPQRAYQTPEALATAIDAAFQSYDVKLTSQPLQHPA